MPTPFPLAWLFLPVALGHLALAAWCARWRTRTGWTLAAFNIAAAALILAVMLARLLAP